ncbi:hypothetical protein TanjilG_31902 [Lupinus angustifolius]|uniref:Uncharacterized protein n=1 Tax=Lupinus angustifolius TaxID=3871 RepID=A0A1J7HFI0_LUPAN|nr:PREDICTED: uncharacterized protein LOC109348060 [Lupinus angustifolius]OIW11623.1 hypothetical protein TanjilG_31902 [Lupinus angustifolius]
MGSQVCEALAFMNGDDGVSEMEVMEINGALLMSLMEESPSDESDDDRLDNLIRSFEAEITSGSKKMEGHNSACIGSEFVSNIGEENQSWIIGEMDGQDCWGSSSEFGMEWVDMDVITYSPCDNRSWFIDPHGDVMDNKVGLLWENMDSISYDKAL